VHELTLPARTVIRATPRTRIIHVDLGETAFDFHAGQAVFAGLAESSVRRPYSIACSPGQTARTNAIELLVQIDDHEPPDPHLEQAIPGTLLRIQGPFGNFRLPDGLSGALLLVAGGTGIAPLRSMMWDQFDRGARVDITVVYSARTPDEFAFADELRALAAQRRIHLVMTVTRHQVGDWAGGRGRVSEELIRGVLSTVDTHAIVCGPAALVADTTRILGSLGVSANRIVTETYSS
jgi:ferredoxin-NADP reductase